MTQILHNVWLYKPAQYQSGYVMMYVYNMYNIVNMVKHTIYLNPLSLAIETQLDALNNDGLNVLYKLK